MSLLLHVLLNCLPTKKCLPKQVCFIYCSSTALFVFGSHTLSCYQQPKLHKCKKWAWGKGKKEKGSLILPPITAWDGESTSNEKLQFSQNQAKQATGELGNDLLSTSAGQLASLLQFPLGLGLASRADGCVQRSVLDISFQMLLVHKICRRPTNSRYIHCPLLEPIQV